MKGGNMKKNVGNLDGVIYHTIYHMHISVAEISPQQMFSFQTI